VNKNTHITSGESRFIGRERERDTYTHKHNYTGKEREPERIKRAK
jgi:hypothetical protein